MALAALIPLLAETLGFKLSTNYNEIINSILGILILLRIINNPTTENHGLLDDVVKSVKVIKQIYKVIK